MRETEVEHTVEEVEVERVCCDTCGDQCDDDPHIEATELCESCATGTTFEEYKERFDYNIKTPVQDMNIVVCVVFALLSPLLVLLGTGVSLFADEEAERHGARFDTSVAIGSILYTIVIMVLIL